MMHIQILCIRKFERTVALMVSVASLSMFERKNISGKMSDMNL
jgi:hypothetical protein